MFAALNTLEPHVQNLAAIDLFHAEEEWAKARAFFFAILGFLTYQLVR
jgi:hypothetical protein